jgi:hypothetical protein
MKRERPMLAVRDGAATPFSALPGGTLMSTELPTISDVRDFA